MEYDFKSLSDYDFELLCCDLFAALLRRRTESFRRGRDCGIDVRCSGAGNSKIIIQCKHYANTPFSGLYSTMSAELEKIKKLKPMRYMLATSQFLTPAEKEKLLLLLQPYCKSTEDILGGNELNSLLRQFPQVEQAHYKLWLTSTAVLQKILHSKTYLQSEFLQTEMKEKLQLYVQSKKAYGKARNILHECGCCIISGIPGIGKTTLAEILLIFYMEQDYEVVKISTDIREALDAYRADAKQVFFYDDFLGSTALDMSRNQNEGKELLSFLGRISKQKGKKFILTTREYILNQARQSSEEFSRQNFDINKCIISLADYTKMDRAQILYNHLYFHKVPAACVEDLLVEGRIMNIINHPNYSPRLIESVTDLLFPTGGESFYDFFINTLNHPNQLWENSFCRKISPAARDLLLLLFTFHGPVHQSTLKEQYEPYHRQKALAENRPMRATDFLDALRETEGTFLKIDRGRVTFHNPSVQDFLQGYFEENDGEFRVLCEVVATFGQSIWLLGRSMLGDKRLCRLHCAPLVQMVKRTLCPEKLPLFRYEDSIGNQMVQLMRLLQQMDFPELQNMVQEFVRTLPAKLDEERQSLNEDNWDTMDAPDNLKDLLADFELPWLEIQLSDATYKMILAYAKQWLTVAFVYSREDFQLFPALHAHIAFSATEESFEDVNMALEDYYDNIAPDEIEAFINEADCEDFLAEIKELKPLFHYNFNAVTEMVYDRMRFLWEEMEDDDRYHDFEPPKAPPDDSAILDMFHSLLSREPADDCAPVSCVLP